MFSSYDGAKRQAKKLHSALADNFVVYPLNRCQTAVATAGGYRNWHDMKSAVTGRASQNDIKEYRDRLLEYLPEPCRRPAVYWLDDVSTEWTEADGVQGSFSKSWYECIFPYEFAMMAVHRRHTDLVRPGSGIGQRLREGLVQTLLLHMSGVDRCPTLDGETLALNYAGTMASMFRGRELEHPNFEREFNRLVDGGVFSWASDRSGIGVLSIFPPSPSILIEHVLMMRQSKEEHDRRAQSFRRAA
jgi:hypothetical protein